MWNIYVAHWMWHITCGTRDVTHYMWHTGCGTSYVAHWMWHIICGTLDVAHYLWHIICGTLDVARHISFARTTAHTCHKTDSITVDKEIKRNCKLRCLWVPKLTDSSLLCYCIERNYIKTCSE